MLIIAGIALVLAMIMKLALLNGWFWYGFFVTLFVITVFMSLVASQAWVLARLIRKIEDHYRPALRRGGFFPTVLTLTMYFLVPALVAAISGFGTYLVINYVTRIFFQ